MVKRSQALLLAAVATSALAAAILNLAGRYALHGAIAPLLSGEVARMAPGLRPSLVYPDPLQTASHFAFHALEGAGLAVMAGVLLLFLAWGPLRRGERWGFAALAVGGLPAAALSVWAVQLFGPWHEDILLIPALWLLSVAVSGAAALMRTREVRAALTHGPVPP